MHMNDDKHPGRRHAPDRPPALLAIDNPIENEFMERIVPNLGGLQKGNAVLGQVCPRLVVIPLENHRTYIQKCMYKSV